MDFSLSLLLHLSILKVLARFPNLDFDGRSDRAQIEIRWKLFQSYVDVHGLGPLVLDHLLAGQPQQGNMLGGKVARTFPEIRISL